MSEFTLKVEKRTEFKKSISNQMRTAGFVPGVYYIHGGDNIPIKAKELPLKQVVLSTESQIINLEIEGEKKPYSCIIKDVQFDPITSRIIHFDLIGIKADEKIDIEVQVILTGAAIGAKEGGLVQHVLHKLELECLPKNIPAHIDVDISNLGIGDSVKVGDLSYEGVTFKNDDKAVIVTVVPPTVTQEEAPKPEGEEEQAEPEVIAKGKKEEEEKEE